MYKVMRCPLYVSYITPSHGGFCYLAINIL